MTVCVVTTEVNQCINPNHLDEYGHLNNARYPLYFEEGRLELQRIAGMDAKSLIDMRVGLFVHRSVYTYKKPVCGNEPVTVQSRFVSYEGGLTLRTFHMMKSEKGLLATANMDHALFDFENDKLITNIPEWLVQRMYVQ